MTKYRQIERVVARQVRGERILVPLASSEEALDSIYVLNETASFIWEQVGVGRSDEEIVRNLTVEYEVSKDQATEDTRVVLADLLGMGVIEEAGV
jgi:hypothetical protein